MRLVLFTLIFVAALAVDFNETCAHEYYHVSKKLETIRIVV